MWHQHSCFQVLVFYNDIVLVHLNKRHQCHLLYVA